MISTIELTVLALVAATVLCLVFRRRLKYADSMVVRLEKLNQAIGDQSIYIRGLGRETLNLRRAQKSKITIRDRFHEKCDEIRSLIKSMTSVDCRIHVFDDRKSKNDLSWVVVVNHQSFKGDILPESRDRLDRQWKVGYRFIVWAPNKERAQDKIEQTYNQSAGFNVTSIDIHDE